MRKRKLESLLASFMGRTQEISDATRELNRNSEKGLENALAVSDDSRTANGAIDDIDETLGLLAAAAEEFSVTMQHIRDNSRLSQENIRSVSHATQELAAASEEIAQNTERARAVSSEAVNNVDSTIRQVSELESIAGEISNVTQVIHDISEQTKVLALNATIEASREAEAGRGFAVVAREVKDLAAETREATSFIRTKVQAIESAIGSTLAAIEGVAGVIKDVNEVVNNIAAAAEEQSITTRDIAANAGSADSHFTDISAAIDEGASTTQDMTQRLAGASEQARTASEASRRVSAASGQIASDATVSFARALEVDQRIADMMAEFDAADIVADFDEQARGEGLVRFSERMSVLVDDMDGDHQRIFDCINRIHASVKSGAPAADQAQLFRDMAEFTSAHFAREEALMERHGYPGLEAQKTAHGKLLSTLGGYAEALQAGRTINLVSVLNFLNNWLQDHILKMDRQYGDYFREQKIEA